MDRSPAYSRVSLEESVQAAREWKQGPGRSLTNCVFLKQTLAEYAAQDRLFCRRGEDSLLFLGDEGAYFQVFYYLREDGAFPVFPHDKPLVVNELDRNGEQLPHIRRIEEKLRTVGFELESRNLYMGIDLRRHEDALRRLYAENEDGLRRQGFRFAVPEGEEQREQVRRLWREHLKPTDIPFAHYAAPNGGGELCCVTDASGTVCAVIWWDSRKKTSEWRHIVTHPAYLRRGLALALLSRWAVAALDAGCTEGYSWCEERNLASIRLQEKLGSRFNGKRSLQYLLP